MSLTKLVILGGLGYLAYRFFSNLPQPEASGGGAGAGGRAGGRGQAGDGRSHAGGTRGARMSGGGQGTTETTSDASGESVPHTVGRGVLH